MTHDAKFPESAESAEQRTQRAITALEIEESAGLGFRRRRSGESAGNPYAKPEQYRIGQPVGSGTVLAGMLAGLAWVLGIGSLLYHPLLLGTVALIAGISATIAGGPTARTARNGLIVASICFFLGMIFAIGLGRPVA